MMKVNFSKKAEWRIDDTAVYIKAEFGRRAEQEFKGKVRNVVRLLRRNPFLGPMYSTASGASFTVSTSWVADTNFVDF